MKSAIIIMALAALCAATSFAETPSDNNADAKKKAKTVSRLYQATYGSSERCKKATPNAAREFQTELDRFVDKYANLLTLVTQSPHYEAARKQFSGHINVDPARDTQETLSDECKYLAQLLRSMNDTPAGKNAVKEFEVLLSH